ncbi:MAG: NAD-binding protein [Actinobacteria bacterium]|nr:NAD-binding protein [Actinomycetota bacterium]
MAGTGNRVRWMRRLMGWPLVALLAATAFVLGYLGFHTRLGSERSAVDIAYLSLQLFTVESGNAAGPSPPITLEIARFAAPAATAYALGRALVEIFRSRIDRWRLKRRSGHVVVAGLGWLGLELVERLVEQGHDVVAVDLDLDEEAVASIGRSKVSVVVGDARDPDVLREARAEAADHIVVLAGADEVSAEVALAARTVYLESAENPVVCLAHIRDPQLCRILRTETLAGPQAEGFRLEFFNVAEEAAAIMLEEHAGFLAGDGPAAIGVVGGNDVAAAVVSEAARVRRRHARDPVRVVIAEEEGVVERLHARFPQLRAGAEVERIGGPDPLVPADVERLASCRLVFVCLDEDTTAIAITLSLAEQLPGTPIVVALGHWAGMAAMLTSGASGTRAIHPFLIPDRLLHADILLAGLGERLAREIHAAYVDLRLSTGARPDDPSLMAWEHLPESLRRSNRAQAAHLGEKLRRIGCGVAPLDDWDAPPEPLTDDEIEELARFEHERFVRQRRSDGWKDGPRDPEKKTSPYLVPWDRLTGPEAEEIKDLDRLAARSVPQLLARAGYRVIRTGEPGGSRP